MEESRVQRGQFAVIPASVLYDDRLPATAKLLYGEISRLAHQTGYCYATNNEFTVVVRCSEKNITRLVAALKDCGYIRVTMVPAKDGKCTMHRRIFCGLELAKVDPPEDWEGVRKNAETPQNCLPPLRKTVHATYNINKINNTPIVPMEYLSKIEAYCQGDEVLQAEILNLLENRKAIGKPVKTMRTMNGILRDLDKHSHGNRAVKLQLLDKALVANWLTVFPLKPWEVPKPERAPAGEEFMDGI